MQRLRHGKCYLFFFMTGPVPVPAIDLLVRFARLLSTADSADEILHLLAVETASQFGVEATAVVEVLATGQARIVASAALPSVLGTTVDPDTIGSELGQCLVAAGGGRFSESRTLPLVSGGNLVGALVLLSGKAIALDESQLQLVSGLADLAAIALDNAHQYARLERAYEELRSARAALAHGEKLRLLGEMAAGVAHDLRNVFTPLVFQVERLRRKAEEGPKALAPVIASFERSLQRGLDMVERLRQFGRHEPSVSRSVVDVNLLVREVKEMCQARLEAAHVVLELSLGESLNARLEPSEFVSAILNLVANAIDALQPRGGQITIRTSLDEEQVRIEVADDGPGVPPDIQAHIFEPFFTTKGYTGTGLGLAIIAAFVARNDGTIGVLSKPGDGAAFTLSFPLARGSVLPASVGA